MMRPRLTCLSRPIKGPAFQCQRTNRTTLDTRTALTTILANAPGPVEITDHRVEPTLRERQLRSFALSSADLDTPAAQNTTIGIIIEAGMDSVDCGFFQAARKRLGFQSDLQKHGDILKGALAVGGAVFTIDIVNRQKQSQGRCLQLPDRGGVGPDRHSVADRNAAGSHRLILTFYFNETQAAASRSSFAAFQIAQIGNIVPVVQAGFQQGHSFLRFNPLSVNHNCHHGSAFRSFDII